MAKFCQFEKTTSDRKFHVNANEIMMVSYGEDNDSTTLELTGQRSILIKGNVQATMDLIKAAE
jgi:uncharacterized protein YkuJ